MHFNLMSGFNTHSSSHSSARLWRIKCVYYCILLQISVSSYCSVFSSLVCHDETHLIQLSSTWRRMKPVWRYYLGMVLLTCCIQASQSTIAFHFSFSFWKVTLGEFWCWCFAAFWLGRVFTWVVCSPGLRGIPQKRLHESNSVMAQTADMLIFPVLLSH